MFQGKKILLGVTGSIAAYKSLLLVRLLIKEGASVKVVLTPAARDFVTPLSLATLSKHPVLVDLFEEDTWANHVELGRWADVFVVAPLSCNTLAKMAHGLCDNLLLATYLSAICPVVVAPAMDEDMWKHPSTKANLERLGQFGNKIIPVERGELASGLYGDGRMAEPEKILGYIRDHVFGGEGGNPVGADVNPIGAGVLITMDKNSLETAGPSVLSNAGSGGDLAGKKALVTAGPTYEALDPVRFIGNHSSGKMGISIAKELADRGALVDLVLGPSAQEADYPGVRVYRVVSAVEMYNACLERWSGADIAVMSAAVADYTPVTQSKEKIKKKSDTFILELAKTKDILKMLGQQKKRGQVLVGFALETTGEREYALEKLKTKNADLIVLNSLNDAGAGFGYDTNKITIFGSDGHESSYEQKTKQQVARDIVDSIVKLLYA